MSERIISLKDKQLDIPDEPVIPFIEGDGIGPDVWSAASRVIDSAVEKAYSGKRKIQWKEVFAGGKSMERFGTWLPDETINDFTKYRIGIKGPLTTPVGGGIRSLNVALRQILDLYVCLRPVKYYEGIVTPMTDPRKVDMIIFRENTEDIYTGIEFKAGTPDGDKMLDFLHTEFPERFDKIRFGTVEKTNEFLELSGREPSGNVEVGLGIKVISKTGTERLIIAAIDYAIANKRRSVTIIHKGNIMKFTSGSFRDWGYDIAEKIYGNKVYTSRHWEHTMSISGREAAYLEEREAMANGKIIIRDAIADNALQQVLINPESFDIIATENLNGDYMSDAIAAQVGGIGIAPGANINYITGHAIFEATHGTAPQIAGLDKANPSSLILSGKMMMEYMNWYEAAELIEKGINAAIASKKVTFDFAQLMNDSIEVKCSEFAGEIIKYM
jgi:isocitrate dehydrogenase